MRYTFKINVRLAAPSGTFSCTTVHILFSFINYTCLHRIIVNVIQFLNGKAWAVTIL